MSSCGRDQQSGKFLQRTTDLRSMNLKRIMIVIVAGLAFGVTAAYATTNHSSASKAPASHAAPAATFATQADVGAGSTSTGADDPVTHDQTDDQGQDQTSTGDTGGSVDQGDDSQGDDSQGDDSQGDDSQGDDSQASSNQDGSSQSSGDNSDDSGGSGSGGD
jgi:hypothetical protein